MIRGNQRCTIKGRMWAGRREVCSRWGTNGRARNRNILHIWPIGGHLCNENILRICPLGRYVMGKHSLSDQRVGRKMGIYSTSGQWVHTWQKMVIFSTCDQWDGRKWESTRQLTNGLTGNGNILHVSPMGWQKMEYTPRVTCDRLTGKWDYSPHGTCYIGPARDADAGGQERWFAEHFARKAILERNLRLKHMNIT
jgi:hypothetical protein